MEKATICEYPQSDRVLPHWKCAMQCCAKFLCVNLPDQETDYQHSDTSPSIIFHIYHLIACYSTHWRLPLTGKKFRKCKYDSVSEQSTKIYTRKELVMTETTISNFHTSLYIPAIQKLAFHIPYVQIMVTNHCGGSFKDVLCHRDYAERLVASFYHQIQS